MAETPQPLPFDDVYRLHSASVYRFCVSQLGNVAAAEDVTADVFLAALKAYDRVRPDSDGLRAWLFHIARNRVSNHHRGSTRFRRALVRIAGRGSSDEDVERIATIRADLRDALDAMTQLSARDRLLLGLRCAAELPYAEIGAIVGISEKSAAMATSRAAQKLRRQMEEAP